MKKRRGNPALFLLRKRNSRNCSLPNRAWLTLTASLRTMAKSSQFANCEPQRRTMNLNPQFLKPQDVLFLLKLVVLDGPASIFPAVPEALGLSKAEVHNSAKRVRNARLLPHDSWNPLRRNLLEFLVHGVKYVFPGRHGSQTVGMPTAHAAPRSPARLPPAASSNRSGPTRKARPSARRFTRFTRRRHWPPAATLHSTNCWPWSTPSASATCANSNWPNRCSRNACCEAGRSQPRHAGTDGGKTGDAHRTTGFRRRLHHRPVHQRSAAAARITTSLRRPCAASVFRRTCAPTRRSVVGEPANWCSI